jgi:2-dehydropantoate 2-reductase
MIGDCVAEALAVARARRLPLPDDAIEQVMRGIDGLPAAMRSSMLDDLERGRRLELPWLSGAIVRMGEEQGVPTPTHRFIVRALKLHSNGAS